VWYLIVHVILAAIDRYGGWNYALGPGGHDGRFWGCYSIVSLRELVLGLLQALTTSKHGCTIPTLVDMGYSGYTVYNIGNYDLLLSEYWDIE